ncbi:MAG: dimethyl sulfoxide reductase anchor subunit family protein [Hyphomicrobiaceae bacterium]
MHPAYSVIFFTTASGAGYGMLILLAGGILTGLFPRELVFGLVSFAIALGLVTAGLLSSTAHLGRPERAWRAFSQWRSSWLSREGVAAVFTYVPAGLLGLSWIFFGAEGAPVTPVETILAVLAIAGAMGTLYCTGMIYASLRTIRHWNLGIVPLNYMAFGLMTGAVLLGFLLHLFGQVSEGFMWVTLLLLALGLVLKVVYWMQADALKPVTTAEDATGLGHIGKVRPFEAPHSTPNFVMREMGYEIARKHVVRLRNLTFILAFALPILGTILTVFGGTVLSLLGAFLALVTVSIGIFIERWLFFAEAEHVVTVYYGVEAA